MQAVKLRYLNAMGIESWVRRSRPEAAAGMQGDAETTARQNSGEPVAAVRSLLDAKPGTARAPAPAPEREPGSAPNPSSAPAGPALTPEFRLLVLQLAGSVLLVDEALLAPGALRSEQMHLLGDVLRSARLLVHGDATGSIEQQIFYWPQVDDAALDQGLPRAREALAYHVRSRLGDSGPLLHVTQNAEIEAASGSAIARDSLAELTVAVLELSPELLDLQAPGRVRAQAWADLCTLAAAPVGAAP